MGVDVHRAQADERVRVQLRECMHDEEETVELAVQCERRNCRRTPRSEGEDGGGRLYLVDVYEVPELVNAQISECMGRLTVDAPPVEVDMKVLERWHEKDAVVQRVDLADTVKGIREVLRVAVRS